MRGTKLLAWRIPPLIEAMQDGSAPRDGDGSTVLREQQRLVNAARRTLRSIARDVRTGLLETVGVNSRLVMDERSAVQIELPPDTDTHLIARAIDAENVEAWRDGDGHVRVAISPWYTTKDVDQVVLTVTKAVHVLLGIHAPAPPQGFFQRWLGAALEIAALQKKP